MYGLFRPQSSSGWYGRRIGGFGLHVDSGADRQLQNQRAEEKPTLMPFAENEKDEQQVMKLPFALKDYLELVDWADRVQRSDKKGFTSYKSPKLLPTLHLSPAQWKLLAKDIQKESVTMLNGLNKVAIIEKRPAILKSA